jgi:hypothetical protein
VASPRSSSERWPSADLQIDTLQNRLRQKKKAGRLFTVQPSKINIRNY